MLFELRFWFSEANNYFLSVGRILSLCTVTQLACVLSWGWRGSSHNVSCTYSKQPLTKWLVLLQRTTVLSLILSSFGFRPGWSLVPKAPTLFLNSNHALDTATSSILMDIYWHHLPITIDNCQVLCSVEKLVNPVVSSDVFSGRQTKKIHYRQNRRAEVISGLAHFNSWLHAYLKCSKLLKPLSFSSFWWFPH